VRADPRVDATPSGFQAQSDLIAEISAELEDIHQAVLDIRSVREQVEALVNRMAEQQGHDSIVSNGKELTESLTTLEDSLVQNRTADGQTVINFPSRLNFQYIYLRGAVDGAEGMVNDGARQLFDDLSAIWTEYKAELVELLGPRLEEFNALVRAENVPAVLIP
jgi:hypothetical protein